MTLRHTTKGLVLAAHSQQRSSGRSICNDSSSQSVNKTSPRDRETYPGEERAVGRSPVRIAQEREARLAAIYGVQHLSLRLLRRSRAMERAPSPVPFRVNVAGAMLRGDQRRPRPIPARNEPCKTHSCGHPPNSNPWNRGIFFIVP